MRAVFAHDHIFFRDLNGNYYTSGKLPYLVWQRYLQVFDQLTVAGRMAELSERSPVDIDLSSGPLVNFIQIPSLSDPVAIFKERQRARESLVQAVAGADALIARLPSLIGRLAVEVAEALKKPWAAEVVGCPWDALWNYGTWQGKISAPVSWLRTRTAVRRAPYAIYVTKNFLQRRYPCKGKTARASNVEIPNVGEDVLNARLKFIGDRKAHLVFGCIGSLSSAYKGIDTSLRALSAIKGDLPDFQFQILGGGDQTRWRRLAKDFGLDKNVQFLGTLTAGDAVFSWLDKVDLYLQPSRQEGLPRSLVEAMSRGCPALGSTAGGIPELLPRSCLVRPGDHSTLARLIKTSISDASWQTESAKKNFAEAKNYFSESLNATRNAFWSDFGAYVRSLKK